ncbi:Trk system potassium transporter TrkA [Candidatus Venteria ishoeyi]|uniref:Trk system potassium uptake protein TrkA n=1 Tax=Candidatus Venteria ishoeyi TaxID=1899563 RepID=A0A1H6FEZ4_9GAMM|nr:Trk system potassium transporter TrkA [Candidatus Venteria ishoeyi]MDM8546681.1 Trk system potassium transporter TrkA [Candidatus Venteria ishoeyi]SEH07605.1 Trk system potassium uptake protein TrkA [Candidatus Venteria ishoeyi]
MKIIILGAGQVGSSVAANLANEANDVTVVDSNEKALNHLRNHYDLRTVHGHASHPDVLQQAGAEDAELMLAVTNSDETNMVACQIARILFKITNRIARVRKPEYLGYPQLFEEKGFSISEHISPEMLVTRAIQRLIDYPDALQVQDFTDGKVQLVATKAFYGGPLVGHELRTLHDHIPNIDSRIVAIYRRGRAITPEGKQVIEADDEVFFLAAAPHVRKVMSEMRKLEKPIRRVMIGGAGNIGKRLAESLESHYHVKLIEYDSERAAEVSTLFDRVIVLEGDVGDETLLKEANVKETDIFCALTNDDQLNILAAMLAKRLGARKVMALINRSSYVDLVESSNIDIAISPQQITIGSLLARVRRGDVVRVHALRRGAAEAIEAIAHGDRNSSKVVGRKIEDIKLPPQTTIGAIVRGDEVIMPHHDTVIKSEDHVILFLMDKNHISAVERLFEVGFSFF